MKNKDYKPSVEEIIKVTLKNCMSTFPGFVFDGSISLKRYLSDKKEFFEKELKNKKIIELGPGIHPLASYLFKFGIKEYIGVEPFLNTEYWLGIDSKPLDETHSLEKELKGKAKVYHTDALSSLLKEPDNSAIIISNAVMDTDVINGPFTLEYFDLLISEIYRVTEKEGLTIHFSEFGMPCGYLYNLFLKKGFKEMEKKEERLGVPLVLRK